MAAVRAVIDVITQRACQTQWAQRNSAMRKRRYIRINLDTLLWPCGRLYHVVLRIFETKPPVLSLFIMAVGSGAAGAFLGGGGPCGLAPQVERGVVLLRARTRSRALIRARAGRGS